MVAGLNVAYGVTSDSQGQKYPALQANKYKPNSLKDKPEFCLSSESKSLLSESSILKLKSITGYFSDDEIEMWGFEEDVRWVILGIPKTFVIDKDTDEIGYLTKGLKLAGSNKVTISKVHLACLQGDDLILDDDGYPQVFTLKLKSIKNKLVKDLKDPEYKSIDKLNNAIKRKYKTKDNLIHLVSVGLVVDAYKFTSSYTKASSLGVMFSLSGEAKALSEDNQKQIHYLISNTDILDDIRDPFNLSQKDNKSNNTSIKEDNSDDDESSDILF